MDRDTPLILNYLIHHYILSKVQYHHILGMFVIYRIYFWNNIDICMWSINYILIRLSVVYVRNVIYIECMYCVLKRYFNIYQHLARFFEYYGACLLSHPSFLCSQIITIFLIQLFTPIRNQVWNFSQLWKEPKYV